jgi:menaquinol-cytochrome c reductase iron-sulfur subunit
MLQDPSKHPTRRSFYAVLIKLLGAAAAAAIAIPAGVYLLLKPKSPGAGAMVEIANLADLEDGVPQEVVYYRTRVDGWKATKEKTTTWVVKNGPQSAVAFSPQCPHLGCIYHWEDEQGAFKCPCHASAFGTDGKVLAGPAPRPLDRYVSRVEGGKLLIGLQVKRS